MLEVLHTHKPHNVRSIHAGSTVATKAVADYDVGAENNIVDDVINQFPWILIHSHSLSRSFGFTRQIEMQNKKKHTKAENMR